MWSPRFPKTILQSQILYNEQRRSYSANMKLVLKKSVSYTIILVWCQGQCEQVEDALIDK